MKTSIQNRWGARIEVGAHVTIVLPRGGTANGKVTKIETATDEARAYGPRVTLDNGMSASADDCRMGLGANA